jgi:hypothetical protein
VITRSQSKPSQSKPPVLCHPRRIMPAPPYSVPRLHRSMCYLEFLTRHQSIQVCRSRHPHLNSPRGCHPRRSLSMAIGRHPRCPIPSYVPQSRGATPSPVPQPRVHSNFPTAVCHPRHPLPSFGPQPGGHPNLLVARHPRRPKLCTPRHPRRSDPQYRE